MMIDLSLWNVASSTRELFRCDRSRNNEKNKGGAVVFFVPLRLTPKEQKDLNVFDKSRFEFLWVECRCNFWNTFRSKMTLNVTYDPMKTNQNDFLEHLLNNIDNANCQSLRITMMGDYNLDFFTALELENLETVILPYRFPVAGPTLPTCFCETMKTHNN